MGKILEKKFVQNEWRSAANALAQDFPQFPKPLFWRI